MMRILVMAVMTMLAAPATFADNDKPPPGKPEQTIHTPGQTPPTRVDPPGKPVATPPPVKTSGTSVRTQGKPSHTALNNPANHGQVVSDCNHRANDRELTGHDRQGYVEWCTSRGHRYDRDYVDQYWNADRSCYGKADDRRMTGDRRSQFLSECLQRDDDRRYPPR